MHNGDSLLPGCVRGVYNGDSLLSGLGEVCTTVTVSSRGWERSVYNGDSLLPGCV